MIPESFISEVLSRTDIVEVIGRYVKLQRKGVNYMACCPFHKEKTPSFAVNQSRQFFKCFGCGESGSAIAFLMKYKGLSPMPLKNWLMRSAWKCLKIRKRNDARHKLAV